MLLIKLRELEEGSDILSVKYSESIQESEQDN
jgi:hypothetical protein